MKRILLSLAAAAAFIAPAAHAANDYNVFITEWMYKGVGPNDGVGEFIEFTNLGTTAVDFTGWSFDDDSRLPLVKRLTEFGIVPRDLARHARRQPGRPVGAVAGG